MDTQTLKTIYNANVTKVYRYFYKRVLDEQTSQDLTSETFLIFLEHIKKNKIIENYQAYLLGIAKNILNKSLKLKYKTEIVENIEEFSDEIYELNDDNKYKEKLLLRVEELVEHLPTAQKNVMICRILQKFNLEETARALGKDINYVKVTGRRALNSLKNLAKCTPSLTNISRGNKNDEI